MNLVDNIVEEIFFNLQNGRPKNGRRSTGISSLERTIVVVFGLEDSGEKNDFCY
jgi:hypothetical protein